MIAWLADNPRWTFHFTPTSCSLLNAVEGFFSKLTRQALRRGAFRSVDDLVATIDRYVASANHDPKPFKWTASAASVAAKLKMHQPNESEHQVERITSGPTLPLPVAHGLECLDGQSVVMFASGFSIMLLRSDAST